MSTLDSGGKYIDSEPPGSQYADACESCDEHHSELFFCKCVFCGECWERETPHRKNRRAPGAIPHEKTDLGLAAQIQAVFSNSIADVVFEELLANDRHTAWFGKCPTYEINSG
jgi:hypothetical protein